MAGLLPSSSNADAAGDGDPRVIGVDSEEADDLLGALQSETARDILAALYDDPRTPSDLAEAADTSIQNVRYHLEKFEDTDLVEVADTVYSEKGREMKVYAPAAAPLVVFAGSDDDAPGVESALSRLLGALGILGLASVLVQRTVGDRGVGPGFGFGAGDDSAAAPTAAENATAGDDTDVDYQVETATESAEQTPAPDTTAGDETVAEESTRTVAETAESADGASTVADTVAQSTTTAAEAAGSAAAGLPPGLVFFLGGAVALAALGAAWYVRAR